MNPEVINAILAPAILVLQILLGFIFVYYLIERKNKNNKLIKLFSKNGLLIAFVVALGSTVFSILYSEFIGFAACVLCWYQRIFMYPLVILLGLALYRKDKGIIDYALVLAAAGSIVSLYHNYIYYGGSSILPCDALGGVSCAQRYVFEFGYITIPLMSLTAFVLIIFSLFLAKRS